MLICFENIIYRTGNEIFLLYMSDCFLQLLGEMTESTMLNVILKHVHRLVAFYSVFPKLVKLMMKVTTYLNLMSFLIYVYILSSDLSSKAKLIIGKDMKTTVKPISI